MSKENLTKSKPFGTWTFVDNIALGSHLKPNFLFFMAILPSLELNVKLSKIEATKKHYEVVTFTMAAEEDDEDAVKSQAHYIAKVRRWQTWAFLAAGSWRCHSLSSTRPRSRKPNSSSGESASIIRSARPSRKIKLWRTPRCYSTSATPDFTPRSSKRKKPVCQLDGDVLIAGDDW